MAWAILDTSVYIDHWEARRYEDALAEIRRAFVIRHSAVVLSELRRGARTLEARRLVDALQRIARIPWTPTADDWWRAGELILRLGDARGWGPAKRREFQNDTLIALTARRHGATVVTANRADFALLAAATGIAVVGLGSRGT